MHDFFHLLEVFNNRTVKNLVENALIVNPSVKKYSKHGALRRFARQPGAQDAPAVIAGCGGIEFANNANLHLSQTMETIL